MIPRRALILESHPKHWNTVEPLARQLAARGYRVALHGPAAFAELLSLPHLAGLDIAFTAHSSRRQLAGLLAPRAGELLFLSPAFLSERPERLASLGRARALLVEWFGLFLACRATRHPGLILHLHRPRWALDDPGAVLPAALALPRRLARRRLLGAARAILVYDQPVAEDLAARLAERGVGKPVLAAPYAVHRGAPPPPPPGEDGRLVVVVPGRIDAAARDYEWAAELAARAGGRVDLWLVGAATGPADRAIPARLVQLGFAQPAAVDGGFVSFAEYDRLLNQAHVFLAPLRRREALLAGRDTITGAVVEAIRVGRPLLLPAWYPISSGLAPVALPYADAEGLVGLILDLARDPARLAAVQAGALAHARDFAAERLNLVPRLEALARPGRG